MLTANRPRAAGISTALAVAMSLFAFAGTALVTTEASAAPVTNDYDLVFSSSGPPAANDCAGDLGQPPNCAWKGSAMLVKFDFDKNGKVTDTTLGTFASIDGSEFSFDFSQGFKWTYTPDNATDPGITAFSVKGGPQGYRVWEKGSAAYLGIGDFSDTWTTWNGEIGGLSHITFFDSVAPIPLPAAAWLLIGGLGGLGLMARRRSKAADA